MLNEPSSLSGPDYIFAGSFDSPPTLDSAIALASEQLLSRQSEKGYWVFELEADCTIPSEYILMMHYMDKINEGLQTKIVNFLRTQQSTDGSYPLYRGGAGDISCTIKAYYAMKLAGDRVHSAHMIKAREWILARGAAAKANVFTHIMLTIQFANSYYPDVDDTAVVAHAMIQAGNRCANGHRCDADNERGFNDASNPAVRNNQDRVGAGLAAFTLDAVGTRGAGCAGATTCTRASGLTSWIGRNVVKSSRNGTIDCAFW